MKKYLLTASMVLMGVGVALAEMYKNPSANTQQPASISYTGVRYATASFTTAITTVTEYGTRYSTQTTGYILYGVLFGTGTCGLDYVDVFDSTSIASVTQAVNDATDRTLGGVSRFRMFNVNGSTSGGSNYTGSGCACSGFSGVGPGMAGGIIPIRINASMWFKASTQYNNLNLLYWRED